MKLILLNLKGKAIYIILLLICLSLNSCNSVESDAKEVCDCYSDSSIENKVECENLYQKYSKNYQSDLSDSMKFQQRTFGCITSGAMGQMSKAINEATQDFNQSLGNSNADISSLNTQLDEVNQIINDTNNKIESVKTSFYLYSILLILAGIGLAMYGLKRFKISLALAFVIPTIILLQMLNWLSTGWFIAIITVGVLIFVFSKPLTYFTAWFFICVSLLIPFFLIFTDSDFRTIITKVVMAISIAITYVARKHIKATVIGISSGYTFGIGLASIISAQLFVNGEILSAFLLPGLIMLAGILCGLAYQFKYMFNTDVSTASNLSPIEKNEDGSSNKIILNNYVTKKNSIIAISLLILAGLFFGYTSFSKNNLATERTEVVQDSTKQEIQEISNIGKDQVVQENQDAIINDESQEETYHNANTLIGEWWGAFGNDQLLLNIENINDDGSVTGYNIVRDNRRDLSGFVRDDKFELNEPGNEKWDGVFKFSISDGLLKGTWVSNNGKSRREFTLSK